MNFNKNNLNESLSPYLRKHADNPIYWQEWKQEVLQYAKEKGIKILVSSGYSTCHWCHVMARNTYSINKVAEILNEDFICIKLDKEERPDIDQFLMSFMTEYYGHGGWPLNVLLSPDLEPYYAFTYAPAEDFLRIIDHTNDFYNNNKENLMHYMPFSRTAKSRDKKFIETIFNYYDDNNKGFKGHQKFPPHSSLHFLLFYHYIAKDEYAKKMAFETLDKMALSGLFDPVEGGFFRYCTDPQWKIPHFEKMMYDQAMHISNYALAYIISGKNKYLKILEKTLEYIETQKSPEGLYYTALDADTDGIEGAFYLWNKDEISDIIDDNFTLIEYEKKFHLIKNTFKDTEDIENKLLEIRNKRKPPFMDKKILILNNCLLAIGFYYSGIALKNKDYIQKGFHIYKTLKKIWEKEKSLPNLIFEEELRFHELLGNYAVFLILSTFFEEDKNIIRKLKERVLEFYKDNNWFTSLNSELGNIPANSFDHPVPSELSLAKMGIIRADLILEEINEKDDYLMPYTSDYYNLAVFIKENFIILHTREILNDLPIDIIQIRSNHYQLCHKGRCIRFDSKAELEKEILKLV